MMSWYDPYQGRYRSTLVHKLVFVWGWPLVRWVMFHCMPSETAHHVGIRSLKYLDYANKAWAWVSIPLTLLWIVVIEIWVTYLYLWILEKSGRVMTGPRTEPKP